MSDTRELFEVREFEDLLNEDQRAKYNEFIEKTILIEDNSAIGGRYSFEFIPTSLGMITLVKDKLTNTSVDLTEYSSW